MDPSQFEIAVREIIESELISAGVEVHRRRRILGRSGYAHEIDLSFEVEIVGTSVLVIVECKALSRPVGVDDVLEFSSRLADIKAHKGLMVATSGFTRGALRFAEANAIALAKVQVGEWMIVRRATGFRPPRFSTSNFLLGSATVDLKGNRLVLGLDPVDEVDLLGVYTLKSHHIELLSNQSVIHGKRPSVRVVFELPRPKITELQPGELILFCF